MDNINMDYSGSNEFMLSGENYRKWILRRCEQLDLNFRTLAELIMKNEYVESYKFTSLSEFENAVRTSAECLKYDDSLFIDIYFTILNELVSELTISRKELSERTGISVRKFENYFRHSQKPTYENIAKIENYIESIIVYHGYEHRASSEFSKILGAFMGEAKIPQSEMEKQLIEDKRMIDIHSGYLCKILYYNKKIDTRSQYIIISCFINNFSNRINIHRINEILDYYSVNSVVNSEE